VIAGRVLHGGSVTARAIHLHAPLSFVSRVVVMPGSRGSSGTPGILAESIRLGTGPAALIIQKADINLTAGAIVAAALYGLYCPIVLLDDESLDAVASWPVISMTSDGVLTSATMSDRARSHRT
jgi:predicted aconitase with swiveling domain